MKRNELKSWAKKELDHINRALKTQALTDSERAELKDRAAALSEHRAAPWLPSDWGRRLIRKAPWLPTNLGSRLMVPVAVAVALSSVHLHSNGFHDALVRLLMWSMAFGCILSPRMNAESRYVLSRVFSWVRK